MKICRFKKAPILAPSSGARKYFILILLAASVLPSLSQAQLAFDNSSVLFFYAVPIGGTANNNGTALQAWNTTAGIIHNRTLTNASGTSGNVRTIVSCDSVNKNQVMTLGMTDLLALELQIINASNFVAEFNITQNLTNARGYPANCFSEDLSGRMIAVYGDYNNNQTLKFEIWNGTTLVSNTTILNFSQPNSPQVPFFFFGTANRYGTNEAIVWGDVGGSLSSQTWATIWNSTETNIMDAVNLTQVGGGGTTTNDSGGNWNRSSSCAFESISGRAVCIYGNKTDVSNIYIRTRNSTETGGGWNGIQKEPSSRLNFSTFVTYIECKADPMSNNITCIASSQARGGASNTSAFIWNGTNITAESTLTMNGKVGCATNYYGCLDVQYKYLTDNSSAPETIVLYGSIANGDFVNTTRWNGVTWTNMTKSIDTTPQTSANVDTIRATSNINGVAGNSSYWLWMIVRNSSAAFNVQSWNSTTWENFNILTELTLASSRVPISALWLRNDNMTPIFRDMWENDTNVLTGGKAMLNATTKDNFQIDCSWLSTNETGQWLNYSNTVVCNAVKGATWKYTSFFWSNDSIVTSTNVGWKVCSNDTKGLADCSQQGWFLAGQVLQPPTVAIQSPANTTYRDALNLALNYTIIQDESTLDKCWYQLNSTANVSLSNCANTTIAADYGWNNITVAVNTTSGLWGSSIVFFSDVQVQTAGINLTNRTAYFNGTATLSSSGGWYNNVSVSVVNTSRAIVFPYTTGFQGNIIMTTLYNNTILQFVQNSTAAITSYNISAFIAEFDSGVRVIRNQTTLSAGTRSAIVDFNVTNSAGSVNLSKSYVKVSCTTNSTTSATVATGNCFIYANFTDSTSVLLSRNSSGTTAGQVILDWQVIEFLDNSTVQYVNWTMTGTLNSSIATIPNAIDPAHTYLDCNYNSTGMTDNTATMQRLRFNITSTTVINVTRNTSATADNIQINCFVVSLNNTDANVTRVDFTRSGTAQFGTQALSRTINVSRAVIAYSSCESQTSGYVQSYPAFILNSTQINYTIANPGIANQNTDCTAYIVEWPATQTIPPTVAIQSPSNTTYTGVANLTLNYTVDSNIHTLDKCWYQLNSTANVSLSNCANTTVTGLGIGWNNITVWANTSGGLWGSSIVFFSVAPPAVIIQTPSNATYMDATSLTLNYTITKGNIVLDKCWYQLNSTANSTLSNCANTTIAVSSGWNNITVGVNTSSGLWGSSITFFSVSRTESLNATNLFANSSVDNAGSGTINMTVAVRDTSKTITHITQQETNPAYRYGIRLFNSTLLELIGNNFTTTLAINTNVFVQEFDSGIRVVRGEANLTAGTANMLVDLGTSVNWSRAMLKATFYTNVTGVANASTPTNEADYLVLANYTNDTTVFFARNQSARNQTTVLYEVWEFRDNTTVQSGTNKYQSNRLLINLSRPVDLNHSFVYFTYNTSVGNTYTVNAIRANLTNTTLLNFTSDTAGNGMWISWWVVNFTDAKVNVTKVDVRFADGIQTITQDLGVAINLSRYMIFISAESPAFQHGRSVAEANMSNTTFIRVSRESGTSAVQTTAFVIQWPATQTIPPTVTVASPTNTTYRSGTTVSLNYTVAANVHTLDKCWYTFNSINTTLPGCANTSVTGIGYGWNNITVGVNTSSGLWGSSITFFSVSRTESLNATNLFANSSVDNSGDGVTINMTVAVTNTSRTITHITQQEVSPSFRYGVRLFNSTLLELIGNNFTSASNPINTTVFVQEFDSGIRVLRGEVNLTDGTPNVLANLGTSVDWSRALLKATFYTNVTGVANTVTSEADVLIFANYTNDTTVFFARNQSAKNTTTVLYEVWEFQDNTTVQGGTNKYQSTNLLINLSRPVDLNHSFVYFTYNTSVGNTYTVNAIRANLTSPTKLNFTSNTGGNGMWISWWVVNFSDALVNVTKVDVALTGTTQVVTQDLGVAINLSRYMIFVSSQSTVTGHGRAVVEANMSNTTFIRISTQGGASATVQTTAFVVQWPSTKWAPAPGPAININSPSNTTYNGIFNASLALNYTLTQYGAVLDRCWYRLDNAANVTLGNWYSSSWQYRKLITFNSTAIAENGLTDLPVLIDVSDSNFTSKAQSDGDDFLFVNSTGTKLNHEVEFYNSSSGHIIAWVRMPTLLNTTNQTIYIYYGNPAAQNQQNKAGVWNASYRAVWHLANGTSLDLKDSTGNGNNGTGSGSPNATNGAVDGGMNLSRAVPQFVTVPNTESLSIDNSWTVSSWAYINSIPATSYLSMVTKGGSTNYGLAYENEGITAGVKGWLVWFNGGGGSFRNTRYSIIPSTSQWYWVTGTWDSATKNLSLYVDGVPANITNQGSDAPVTDSTGLALGEDICCAAGRFDGKLDEVRVQDILRTAGWVRTEYNNQKTPSTFYAASAEEQNGNCANTTLTGIGVGWHNITVGANATEGQWTSSSTVFFSVGPPYVTIDDPVNLTYGTTPTIGLYYTITSYSSVTDKCWYQLNSTANSTLASCGNTTLIGIDNGWNNLTVGINTSDGEWASSIVFFSATTPSTCVPTQGQDWLIRAQDNCVIDGKDYSVLYITIEGKGRVIFRNSNITSTGCAINPASGQYVSLVIEPTTRWDNAC